MSAAPETVRVTGAVAVAFIGFSTESPHGARADVHIADAARELRRIGIASRVFHMHLVQGDEVENGRRCEDLVRRLVELGCAWTVFKEVWRPELGSRLLEAGIGVVETQNLTFPGAVFVEQQDLLKHVGGLATDRKLDEIADLVEIVGPRQPSPIKSIDLRIRQACAYKAPLAENPFYRDVLDAPEVSAHRGCAYCMSARPDSQGNAELVAEMIVNRIRDDRRVFPSVETFWMAFAETFYDALAIAFRKHRGDPAWQGITLSMQCRPDVIAKRAAEIEALAADASASGTRIRIGVVGFENFSPPEILVLNRGAAPEFLDTAAEILNRWLIDTPPGLVVRDFTPSFILFTPWTHVEDLELNLERIERFGFWNANIERLRIGPGTPTYVKAERHGLVREGPVRAAAHPNGYTSEREIGFADPRVAAISEGFESLRPLAFREQPELLAAVVDAVRSRAPQSIDWRGVQHDWEDLRRATQA